MIKKSIAVLIFCFCLCGLPAKAGFLTDLHQSKPLSSDSTYTFDEKIEIYQAFLEEGKVQNNELQQIYAYLHLSDVYNDVQNFTKGFEYSLKAEKIAIEAENDFWRSGVIHHKASVYAYIDDYESALRFFEESLKFSYAAADSQSIAINLEQIGSAYSELSNSDTAFWYYKQAIPLIKRHCNKRSLGVTLSNYGILLLNEERPNEAIPYFEEAIDAAREMKDKFREMAFTSNLASAYFDNEKVDKALELWEKCVEINQENDWEDLLIRNYEGISDLYERKQDFENALFYYKQSHHLQDSIMGKEVQKKMTILEGKYESQKKELAFQKNKLQLKQSQQALERVLLILFVFFLLGSFGVWKWREQNRHGKQLLEKNQENLQNITYLLHQKNIQLEKLEKEIAAVSATNSQPIEAKNEIEEISESIYNQRILTNADWELFKQNFEKSYPGFLTILRTTYSNLSDAEERLFLLIKLRLNSKEIAEILGISIGGVKKTRYRLRKKLNLESDDSLEEAVYSF